MTRHEDKWVNTMVVKRKSLYALYKLSKIGTTNTDNLALYLTFKDDKMVCKKADFTPFIDDFSAFPNIPH